MAQSQKHIEHSFTVKDQSSKYRISVVNYEKNTKEVPLNTNYQDKGKRFKTL